MRVLPLLPIALFACSSSDPPTSSRGDAEQGGEVTATNPYGLTEVECKASPAPAVFGNALCVCGDLFDVGNLTVKNGGDGTLGSVGVNGTTRLVNNAGVYGSWANGKALKAIGNVIVGGSMYTPADLEIAGNMEIGKDMNVGGGLFEPRLLAEQLLPQLRRLLDEFNSRQRNDSLFDLPRL